MLAADFGRVGYKYGAELPSTAEVGGQLVELPHESGDQTTRIQEAINAMASVSVDDDTGFRGTVHLGAGTWVVSDTLTLGVSGVVLAGEGMSAPTQPTHQPVGLHELAG